METLTYAQPGLDPNWCKLDQATGRMNQLRPILIGLRHTQLKPKSKLGLKLMNLRGDGVWPCWLNPWPTQSDSHLHKECGHDHSGLDPRPRTIGLGPALSPVSLKLTPSRPKPNGGHPGPRP